MLVTKWFYGEYTTKIRDDVVAGLEQKEGNSFSDKIEGLLKKRYSTK